MRSGRTEKNQQGGERRGQNREAYVEIQPEQSEDAEAAYARVSRR